MVCVWGGGGCEFQKNWGDGLPSQHLISFEPFVNCFVVILVNFLYFIYNNLLSSFFRPPHPNYPLHTPQVLYKAFLKVFVSKLIGVSKIHPHISALLQRSEECVILESICCH